MCTNDLFDKIDKEKKKYAANVIVNQKYNIFTFIPLVLYEQFVIFFNLYFLLVALSQFIPALKIGKYKWIHYLYIVFKQIDS